MKEIRYKVNPEFPILLETGCPFDVHQWKPIDKIKVGSQYCREDCKYYRGQIDNARVILCDCREKETLSTATCNYASNANDEELFVVFDDRFTPEPFICTIEEFKQYCVEMNYEYDAFALQSATEDDVLNYERWEVGK